MCESQSNLVVHCIMTIKSILFYSVFVSHSSAAGTYERFFQRFSRLSTTFDNDNQGLILPNFTLVSHS